MRQRSSRSISSAASANYWNLDYVPTKVGTEPIRVAPQSAPWVALDGTRSRPNIRERRKLNPANNIELFATGAGPRSAAAKEVGVPRVTQQWKEGLREWNDEPLRPHDREIEQLRTLMRRGEGIGVAGDEWTPYTGPTVDEIISREIAKLAVGDEPAENDAPAPAMLAVVEGAVAAEKARKQAEEEQEPPAKEIS